MTNSKPYSFTSIFIIILAFVALIFVLSFALKIIALESSQQNFETAVYIIDGDTFQTASGETIRLLCVDTPEEKQTGYDEAKTYLSSLVLGKNIILEKDGQDKYNRTLAWIITDGININKAIADNGFGSLWVFNDTNCSKIK